MKSGYRLIIAHKTLYHSWQMKKIMEPQVILLIKKECNSFMILLPSVLQIDAIIIDNDTTIILGWFCKKPTKHISEFSSLLTGFRLTSDARLPPDCKNCVLLPIKQWENVTLLLDKCWKNVFCGYSGSSDNGFCSQNPGLGIRINMAMFMLTSPETHFPGVTSWVLTAHSIECVSDKDSDHQWHFSLLPLV